MAKNGKAMGQKVKQFRLLREMTQQKAAVFFGVSKATYVRIEQGKGCGDLIRAKIERILAQQAVAA